MEICWHVFGEILRNFARIYVLPAVESGRTKLANERSQVGMGFLMAQEVFPSFVRATAVRVMALERHGHMSLQGVRRSRSQAYYEKSILNSVNNTSYTMLDLSCGMWEWDGREDGRAMWAGLSKWAGLTVRDKRCGISDVGGWSFIQQVG